MNDTGSGYDPVRANHDGHGGESTNMSSGKSNPF
jgi:hypothetical protein